MKALFKLFRRFDARRIFGFIRRLGGHVTSKSQVLRFAFYPRPLGGGRPAQECRCRQPCRFLSTPSGWRTTPANSRGGVQRPISIHALRMEGDQTTQLSHHRPNIFLSTPSGWRATAKTDKVFVCFCAKGRRICLFKTRKEKICRWRFKKDKFWVLIWCEGSGKSVCASASHCG